MGLLLIWQLAALPAMPAAEAQAPAAARPTLIVQDFRNRSYELSYDWVGTGLAYLVRRNLGTLPPIVILEDRRAKPGDGEPLADFIVEGEIRLDEGGREPKFVVFVTLERSSSQASRRQFLTEGSAAQLFDMSAYLAERIAQHIGVTVDGQARSRFHRGMTSNVMAFQLFSEAIAERRIHAKIESYERAVLLEPTFAEAHFHLARVHTVLRQYDKAAADLRRTIQLLPDAADAHNDLAYVLAQRNHLAEAEAAYREAIRLNPAAARYVLNLADLLRFQGKFEEARAAYQSVLRLEPDSPDAREGLRLVDRGVTELRMAGMATPPPEATPAGRAGEGAREEPMPREAVPEATGTGSPAETPAPPAATPTPHAPAGPAPTPLATPPAPAATPVPAAPAPAPVATPVAAAPAPGGEPPGGAQVTESDERELAAARRSLARSRGDRAAAQARIDEAERLLRAGDRGGFHAGLADFYQLEGMRYAVVDALKAAVQAAPERAELRERLAAAYEGVGMLGAARRERAIAGER